MFTLKIKDKELKVQYGYEATLKTRTLSKVVKTDNIKETGMEGTEDLLLFLPEFLLVGLQKHHRDEYGFDYEKQTVEKETQIEKMYGLIEDFIDSNDDEDAISLYTSLVEEMLHNGFLKKQFQKEKLKEMKAAVKN